MLSMYLRLNVPQDYTAMISSRICLTGGIGSRTDAVTYVCVPSGSACQSQVSILERLGRRLSV